MSTNRASAQSLLFPSLPGAILLCLLILLRACPCPLLAAEGTPSLFVPQAAQVQTELIGYTRARHVMDIVSKESGFCQEVMADVGDKLGPGGVFARLETTFIDLDLQRNQQLQSQVTSRIAYLDKEVGRYRRLFQNKHIDESTLDRLLNDLTQARKERDILRTEKRILEERKKEHVLRAQPGWRIISRQIQPGEWVRSGEVLGRAGDYHTLLIPFALAPQELTSLRSHNPKVNLFFADVPARVPARIEYISPAFDPQTRKITVHLAVPTQGLPSQGGLRAVLSLSLPAPSGAVLVPSSAVINTYGESMLVRESGQRIPVVLLGQGPGDTLRVSSDQIQVKDRFQTDPDG